MIPVLSSLHPTLVGPPRIEILAPSHEGEYTGLLLRLDQPSRLCRYRAAVNDLFLERHSRQAFRTAGFLAGAFVGRDLCGVAEAYDIAHDRSAEAAFVVEAAFRGLGFGTALLDAALDWARHAERRSLRLLFAPGNVPMRRMTCRAGGRLAAVEGELEATIALSAEPVDGASRRPA